MCLCVPPALGTHCISGTTKELLVCETVFIDTHATLMKAAFPPKRKERLSTCRAKVRYCRGRYGMVAQSEKNTHCSAVRKRESTVARRSDSCSLSPVNKHNV